jgi:hypothetical protein
MEMDGEIFSMRAAQRQVVRPRSQVMLKATMNIQMKKMAKIPILVMRVLKILYREPMAAEKVYLYL